MFDVWGFIQGLVTMIIGIVVGSYIYTKLIIRQVVRSELKGILKEVSDTLNKDGETKEKLREIIDTVMDELGVKADEMVTRMIRKVKAEFSDYTDLPKIDEYIDKEDM